MITIAGAPLDPGTVLAEVTVLHGRDQAFAPPAASSASLVVEVPAGPMPTWSVGDTLTLAGDAGPVFTGRITELTLTHRERLDEFGIAFTVGVLTVTAMGAVAALGVRTVGDQPWPAEAGTARASRILTAAEVPYVIDGTADQVVLPRDVDSRDALALLDDLAKSTGAAVFDLPTGEVVYQPKADRARPVKDFPWSDFEADFEWDDFDPGFTWDDFSTWHSADSEFPLAIPASAVRWEPDWTTTEAAVVNHARVGYGPASPQLWTELIDQASIDRHGRRYQYTGTQLQNLADAQAYASWLVVTRAEPHWRLGTIQVDPHRLDGPTRAEVLGLMCGDHVTIAGMPNPSPEQTAEGIVEGWTYNIWGADGQLHERITLNLSAPLDSLAVPMWSDHPADHEWQHYSPLITWADLTDPAAIGA